MKLLLDENMPHEFRHELPGHDVFTAVYMGWSSFRNGRLLDVAVAGGFDALLTMDGSLRYQQNVAQPPLAVVVIHAQSNKIEALRPLLLELRKSLNALQPRTVTHVR